jgi:hypothetical protein
LGNDRVMDERAPADGIRRHRQVIGPLSDDDLIAQITTLEPLTDADYDDPAWLTPRGIVPSSCWRRPTRLWTGGSFIH